MSEFDMRCAHWANGDQVPCPPTCPRQSWPRSMFRFTWFRGRQVLRRRFRELAPRRAS